MYDMSCNRRSFVKGAAMGVAAASGAALAGEVLASDAATAQEAGDQAEAAEPVAVYTCDVVVVGAVISGLAAGLQAA